MRLLIPAFSVFVGVLIGVLISSFRLVHFAETVEWGGVLHAAAILMVAVVIDYLYSGRATSEKADTEILLSYVKEVRRVCKVLEQVSATCKAREKLTTTEQHDLSARAKELPQVVHSLEMALTHCDAKLHKLKFEKLKDSLSTLKDSLTDTPFPGPYGTAGIETIKSSFRLFFDELTRIEFAINRR